MQNITQKTKTTTASCTAMLRVGDVFDGVCVCVGLSVLLLCTINASVFLGLVRQYLC